MLLVSGAQQRRFEFVVMHPPQKNPPENRPQVRLLRSQTPSGGFLVKGLPLEFLIQAPCEVVTGGQNDDLVRKRG